MLGIEKDKLNLLCLKLGIQVFTDLDYEFMGEFLICLKPIAETITVLEGDILYGHTLPALFTIQTNFDEIRNDGVVHTLPLLNALESGFERRYNEFLNPFNASAAPYFLAMASHPSYKMDCYPGDKHKATKIYNLILNEAQELAKKDDISLESTGDTDVQGNLVIYTLNYYYNLSKMI